MEIIAYVCMLTFRGLLTGKFTRGQTPTTDTRIGYAAQDEAKFVVQSRPSWSKADANDGMWKLLDEMATIARVHGMCK